MSNIEFFETNGKPIKAWTNGVPVEEDAKKQLKLISGLPFIFKHIAVMPDVHLGKGATVGSVIATKGAIIPAAVGVDIGCGMMAVKLNIKANDLPDNLANLRGMIEAKIPHGRTNNGGEGDKGARNASTLEGTRKVDVMNLNLKLQDFINKNDHRHLIKPASRLVNHIGTLGTGNHFIEVCLDTESNVWIMVHSGSRGIGNAIGTYFIDKAKEEMARYFINVPEQDLSYLVQGTKIYDDYIEAVSWAQDYARLNREIMMNDAIECMKKFVPHIAVDIVESAVNCHHNYVSIENHYNENVIVTRKGAVSAQKDQLGIIPGSMGAKSFIVRGKGNKESFCSCSHGAGRKMSRTAAKKMFTIDDHIKATEGVECRKDADVIDETPQSYKDIDAVMAAQSDLVEIVATLKQILCIKG